MRACLGTIASGSSGNCVYVGMGDAHFLFDAGVSGKKIYAGLSYFNVPQPSGIFVTHEHSDHVRSIGMVARRYGIPVYATPLTWRYFLRHDTLGKLPEELICPIEPGVPMLVQGVEVTAFDVPHDASQPVGYTVQMGAEKIAVATDLGEATPTVEQYLRGAQIIYIESNHDVEMLRNGKYPPHLKKRVLGARGHLSNAAAGVLLVEVCEGLAEAARPHVLLAHLSEENNRPMLAYDTVLRVLDGNEVQVRTLQVAERDYPGELVVLP